MWILTGVLLFLISVVATGFVCLVHQSNQLLLLLSEEFEEPPGYAQLLSEEESRRLFLEVCLNGASDEQHSDD